jgi:hypothetical protein
MNGGENCFKAGAGSAWRRDSNTHESRRLRKGKVLRAGAKIVEQNRCGDTAKREWLRLRQFNFLEGVKVLKKREGALENAVKQRAHLRKLESPQRPGTYGGAERTGYCSCRREWI